MERRLRALDVARRAGAEALLASNPSTVAWLTGFAAEVDSGLLIGGLQRPPDPPTIHGGPSITRLHTKGTCQNP